MMTGGPWDVSQNDYRPTRNPFVSLGWVHILLAVIYIPLAFLITVATQGFIEFVNAVVALPGEFLRACNNGSGPKPEPWLNESYVSNTLFPYLLTLTIFLTILGFAAGIGLLQLRIWGRVCAVVTSFLIIPLFPIGTLIGITTLVSVLRKENIALFR
jgi:hypothetical protein